MTVWNATDPGRQDRTYLVRVERVFKGCDFEADDFVMVTTASQRARCGVSNIVDQRYVFSGRVTTSNSSQPELVRRMHTVHVGSCRYNRRWFGMPRRAKNLLLNQNNTCEDAIPNTTTANEVLP